MVSLPPQYAATYGNGYSLTVTLSHMGVYTVAKSANTYLNQPFVGIRCDPQVVRDRYALIATHERRSCSAKSLRCFPPPRLCHRAAAL